MAKIINFKEYKKYRPTRSVSVDSLEDTVCILIKYLDENKTELEYEMTGSYEKSKLGRHLMGVGLLTIAEDILSGEDPEIITSLLDDMRDAIIGEEEI
jgi:hypothetical protein